MRCIMLCTKTAQGTETEKTTLFFSQFFSIFTATTILVQIQIQACSGQLMPFI